MSDQADQLSLGHSVRVDEKFLLPEDSKCLATQEAVE